MQILTVVSRGMKTYMQSRLNAHGVHAGQQFMLQALWRQDGLTPGELAERIGVETSTVTRAAQRMEGTGLVRRIPDAEDARLVRVYLTERGRALERIIPEVIRDAAAATLRGLSPHEHSELLRLLERVRRNLEELLQQMPG